MLCRRAGRLISTLAAAAVLAGIGAAAIAQPGGTQRALTPTAELAQNGGASAPAATGTDGGVEAPLPSVEPDAVPVPEELPAEPAPPPAETAEPVQMVEPEVVPGPTEETLRSEPGAQEPPVAEPLDIPTRAEVLEREDEPLVPVAVLSAPVGPADEAAPLIDITPAHVAGPPLKQQADLPRAETAQEDDEIVIPVPPEDIPGNDGEGETVEQPAEGGADPVGGLPLTGRALLHPLGAGLLLLLFGAALRMTAPSGPSRARA